MRPLCLLAALLLGLASEARAETPVPAAVQAKWATELYGFVELDVIHDSTESFAEAVGNTLIARPGTYGAGHGRFMIAARNSRLGFKIAAPEFFQIKALALAEMDFLGNQPAGTEAQFFNNPTFRLRRAFLRMETPYVDVLAGQEWLLFGWQTMFQPNNVDMLGVPGELFSRGAQVRLSHVFKTSPVNVEVAAAAVRPPQRDAEYPDGQAGVRFLFNQWRGIHTMGAAVTAEDAAAFGLSGVVRKFNVPAFNAAQKTAVSTTGWGGSADLFLPIIPRAKEAKANALTLTGSFALSAGIADLYTGLNGGGGFPTLPAPAGGGLAPAYVPNVDPGLVTFDAGGHLVPVRWQSFVLGLQYYLPPAGNVWVSANYSQLNSANARSLGAGAKVVDQIQGVNANVFWDVTNAVRLGLEYLLSSDRYGDRVTASNHRVQFVAFYLF